VIINIAPVYEPEEVVRSRFVSTPLKTAQVNTTGESTLIHKNPLVKMA
jgi:hypothetical protein